MYLQFNTIARLKYFNDKLLVFAQKKETELIWVFSYNSEELNKKAKIIGTAKIIKANEKESLKEF